jgi:hypothetical protein
VPRQSVRLRNQLAARPDYLEQVAQMFQSTQFHGESLKAVLVIFTDESVKTDQPEA